MKFRSHFCLFHGATVFKRLAFSFLLLLWTVSLRAQQAIALPGGSSKDLSVLEQTQMDRVLTAYQTVELDLDRATQQVKSSGRYSLPIHGVEYPLLLELNPLRSPKIRWTQTTADGVVNEPLPPLSTYQGTVEGDPHSQVRLLIQPGLFLGYVRTKQDWWFIDPMNKFVPGARAERLVIYREEDVRPQFLGVCGSGMLREHGEGILNSFPPLSFKSAPGAAVSLKQAQVATDADFEFYQAHGANSNSFIEGILNQVDGIYQAQLDLKLVISFENVFTTVSQPYSSTDAPTLLGQFRTEWNTNRATVQRDIAHLFTGKNMNGSTVGIAYLGTVCTSLGYSYGISQDNSFLAKVTAHEMGHNFNAQHDDQVTPPAATCTGSGPLMCSSIQPSGPNQFSQRSKDDIGNFTTTNGSCLDSSPSSPSTPLVTTNPASNVTFSSATLNGAVNPNGSATTVIVQWGTTPSYGSSTTSQPVGSATGTIVLSVNLTGLFSNTTYHYQVVATNAAGTAYGADVSFATVLCTQSVFPINRNIGSVGGTGSVDVTSSAGSCGWNVSSNASWISVTSGGSGVGNGTVSYSVAANLSTSPRNGTLAIAGQTFTVSQAGVSGSGLDLAFTTSSGISKTSSSQAPLSVAYGEIIAGTSTQPVALSNYGFVQNGVLVTEVGVAASSPVMSARMFVDFADGINSGVAIVNPNDTPLTINLDLKNQPGGSNSLSSLTVGPRGHLARFVNEMGLNLPNPFMGTLTFTSSSPFAAVNLRTATNGHGEQVLTALPVSDLNQLPPGNTLIFSQIVDGGGAPTEILLFNPSSSTPGTGSISFFDDNGNPLSLDFGPGFGVQNSISYSMPPNGMAKFATTGAGALRVGYAVVARSGGLLPVGSGIFSIVSAFGLASQAGVPNARPTTYARLFVEVASSPLSRNTGIAVVNRNGVTAFVNLTLNGLDGTIRTGQIVLAPNAHKAQFISELFPGLPSGFQGVLSMSSNVAIAALTLRLTTNQRGEGIYSTLPAADLNNPPTGPQYLSQIVNGGGYQTELLLLNTSGMQGTIHINFIDDNGGYVGFVWQ